MHLTALDWCILISFFAVIIVVGLSYSARAGKSISNFFLGGRNLPWYLAGISMVATTFAADTPLAVTELVGKNGIAGNWLWWNMLAGGMLTTFFFARLWRRANIVTEVELIELRYSGKAAAFLRGFKALYLGLFINVLIIGWINLALISLLEVFFDLSKNDALLYTAGAMLFVAIYSSLSGLLGVVMTDVIQFFVAIIGCIILSLLVLNSEAIGGIDGLKGNLPDGALNFFPHFSNPTGNGSVLSTLSIGMGAFFAYAGIQWWASWYPGAEPGGGGYIAQRMMSAKNEKHAVYATLFFQIAHYCIRPWPWIIVALCALVLYPDLGVDDKKLGFVMAMRDFLPAGLKGLLLAAFFAAYMSTISTHLNWGASYIINDYYHRFIEKDASQKRLVRMSQFATVFLMLAGLSVTTLISTISGVWEFIIECGAGLGLVLILRWYWWRINVWSEISASIAPFIGYAFAHYYLDWKFPDSFFLTVTFTTICWLVITFLTKPTDNNTLISFYQKIHPDGWWRPIAQSLNISNDFSSLIILIGCWLSAIVMTYSILFGMGKLIFQEWNEALICMIFAGTSLFSLRYFMSKSISEE